MLVNLKCVTYIYTTHSSALKGRTIRLQGGGAGSLGQDKFVFLQAGKESFFFYFQYLMAMNGESFFFPPKVVSFYFYTCKEPNFNAHHS